MTQVFISYSRRDLPFVEQLASDLKNAGLDVWYDVSGIAGGARWRSEIENGLRNSQYVIVVLSPDSIASEWVEREFLFSSNLKRKIIPLMYRTCDLPLNYVDLNYIDARGDNYLRNFNVLLQALNLDSATTTLPARKVKNPTFGLTTPYVALIGGVLLLAALFGARKLLAPASAPTPITGSTQAIEVTETSLPAATATTAAIEPSSSPSLAPTESMTATVTPLPTEITDPQDVKMVLVPAGAFTMGSSLPKQGPPHSVYLDAFYIDEFEVTNGQYEKCVKAQVCRAPTKVSSSNRLSYYDDGQYKNFPVIFVNWNMAKIYCDWRGENTQLPTEAQWEKTARGTDERTYPWGDGFDCVYGNFFGCVGETTEVGSYRSGKSVYGAYDMAGNVWEWVSDLYAESFYSSAGATVNNPTGPSGGSSLHVLRGGSWQSGAENIRTTLRYYAGTDYATFGIGFRCAQSVTP